MKFGNCASLTTGPLTGFWYRAIQTQFLAAALATAHTRTIPSRFSAASIARAGDEILYLAEDQQIALFEVQALLGSPYPGGTFVPNPAHAWVIANMHVTLSNVANLCDSSERRKVDTSVQELTGDWRGYMLRDPNPNIAAPYWTNVPTQRLGAALSAVPKIEGFTTYSAKIPTRRNLVIFPQKLLPGSQVSFTFNDAATGKQVTVAIP